MAHSDPWLIEPNGGPNYLSTLGPRISRRILSKYTLNPPGYIRKHQNPLVFDKVVLHITSCSKPNHYLTTPIPGQLGSSTYRRPAVPSTSCLNSSRSCSVHVRTGSLLWMQVTSWSTSSPWVPNTENTHINAYRTWQWGRWVHERKTLLLLTRSKTRSVLADFFFLRQNISVCSWLSWNLVCRPD